MDAYRVGVSIALSGDLTQIIGKLIGDFERLDRAVNSTKENLSGLTGALKSMAAQGKSAADAWQNVAKSIAAAAKSARDAAGASIMPRAGQSSSTSQAQDAINAANAGGRGSQQSAPPGTSLVPYTGGAYARGRYGDPNSGPTIGLPYQSSSLGMLPYIPARPNGGYPMQPYEYEGEIIPPYRGGPSAQTPNEPPTIDATAQRPGARSYGPYGPGGNGIGGQYSPNVPAASGGGGLGGVNGPPGGGGGVMPPLNLPPWMNHQYVPGYAPKPDALAAVPAYMGGHMLVDNFKEAGDFDKEKTALKSLGMTIEEVNKAVQNALSIQQMNIGMSEPDALHLATKLMGVTQEKEIALDPKVIEEYAKLSVVLSQYGKGGQLHEIDASVRAGEFRGILLHKDPKTGREEVDREALSKLLKLFEAAAVITNGDIAPHNMLQSLRSSGVAGALINNDELIRQVSLQIALGSSKSGSAIQGFSQQFIAGRMSEAAANLLIKMGIIRGGGDARHNPYLEKSGVGQFLMHDGAMSTEMMKVAAEAPSQFIMNYLLPKFKEHLHQVYGSAYDNADDKQKLAYETAEGSRVASRIPGGVEMGEVIRNMALMDRDLKAVEGVLERNNVFENQQEGNPLLRLKALEDSVQAMKINLGEKSMPMATTALNNLSRELNELSEWAEKHSSITKYAIEGFAGAVIALGAGAAFAALTSLGGVTGLIAGLGVGAVLAAEGIKSLDKWLQSIGIALSDEEQAKRKKNFDEHGSVIPWWAPIPTTDKVHREPRPEWAQWWKLFGIGSANGSESNVPGDSKPNAPTVMNTNNGPKGTADDPQHVIVTNQITESGIARGVSSYQASKMNRPPPGFTGNDPKLDPFGAFTGMVAAPY